MVTGYGYSVGNGIAIGKAMFLNTDNIITKRIIDDTASEIKRLDQAFEKAKLEIKELSKLALAKVSQPGAAIFDSHLIILEDKEFYNSVCRLILDENVYAEYAIHVVVEDISKRLLMLEDEYIRARAEDFNDIGSRLINSLKNSEKLNAEAKVSAPYVIVVKELTPSFVVQTDKAKVKAIVSLNGSPNSHASILASMMNIPAVVGINKDGLKVPDYDDICVIVDGNKGEVIFEPNDECLKTYEALANDEKARLKKLSELKGKKSVTKSGREIKLLANIGSFKDLDSAIQFDAEGIGLLRTEFLFMNREFPPTEEEQFDIYKEILTKMGDKKVVIRTLDFANDKKVSFLEPCYEENNPALGLRGIRYLLLNQDLFRTQLKALIRASKYGNLSILYPMVTSLDEVIRTLEIVDEVKTEVINEYSDIKAFSLKQGVMVETPACALIAEDIAKKVDFLSIGTNDLTQYTLAIDRQNEMVEDFFDPYHESVLELIRMSVKGAHKEDKTISICGELARDKKMTDMFLDIGVDELSVSPGNILELREYIRTLD